MTINVTLITEPITVRLSNDAVNVSLSPQAAPGIPRGGLVGQVLMKMSDADFDVAWVTLNPVSLSRLLQEDGSAILLEDGSYLLLDDTPAAISKLLLESGGALLLEDGSFLLLEG